MFRETEHKKTNPFTVILMLIAFVIGLVVVIGVAASQGPRKPASEVTLVNNPASQVSAKG